MNNIERDWDSNVNWSLKRKKEPSKREIIKKRKIAGEPHINHVGKAKSGVVIGPDCR